MNANAENLRRIARALLKQADELDGIEAPRHAIRTGKWTEARLLLLREMRADGEAADNMLSRLNDLPGAPIATVQAIYSKVKELGLPRPVIEKIVIAPPKPRATVCPQGEAGEAVQVDWRDALNWGLRNRVSLGRSLAQDIAAINARRVELSVPPFRIAKTLSGIAAERRNA